MDDAAELFEEAAPAGDAEALGRSRAHAASRVPRALPGVLEECADGQHRLCAVEVLCQASWATAGREPPSPFDAPLETRRCACACHGGQT